MGIVTAMDAGAGAQAVLDLHPDLARARALKVAGTLARAAGPAIDPTVGLETRVATELVPCVRQRVTGGGLGVRASCCPPQSFLGQYHRTMCVECLFLRSLVICHGAVGMFEHETFEHQDSGVSRWYGLLGLRSRYLCGGVM